MVIFLKRIIALILVGMFLFVGCGSSDKPEENYIRKIDGVKYYDAKAAGADKQIILVDPFTGKSAGNHNDYFPEDAEGYYLDDMIFYVDEDVFYRILEKPCAGTGSIKWTGYNDRVSWHGDGVGLDGKPAGNDWFDGILPIEKFDDPLYIFMCKPSERVNYMGGSRINAGVQVPGDDRFVSILTMGAIYSNVNKPIPDDAEFTICLGRMKVVLYTEEKGWFVARECETPAKPNSIYYLPWTLEFNGLPPAKLPDDRLSIVDGHYEVKLKGAELNGKAGKEKESEFKVDGSVLHFWSPKTPVENAGDIKAIAVSYECWVKEPEWAEYLVAEIGADWYDADNNITQAFIGHNYAITTEPRVIFGHTAGPDMYDEIMDTEKVQELLGLK